jgi:hypothetical protein
MNRKLRKRIGIGTGILTPVLAVAVALLMVGTSSAARPPISGPTPSTNCPVSFQLGVGFSNLVGGGSWSSIFSQLTYEQCAPPNEKDVSHSGWSNFVDLISNYADTAVWAQIYVQFSGAFFDGGSSCYISGLFCYAGDWGSVYSTSSPTLTGAWHTVGTSPEVFTGIDGVLGGFYNYYWSEEGISVSYLYTEVKVPAESDILIGFADRFFGQLGVLNGLCSATSTAALTFFGCDSSLGPVYVPSYYSPGEVDFAVCVPYFGDICSPLYAPLPETPGPFPLIGAEI